MRCPYLSDSSKKVCIKMLEKNLDGEVSDFDIRHFCDGNPIYCYYFRLPAIKAAMKNKNPTKLKSASLKPEIPATAPLPTGVAAKLNNDLKPKREQL
ncbi:MAG: hypothetical protein U9O89_07400 [Thermoproteota archaeon]|nr:hypothetical protein [Thermoproteota archaeon]